MLIGHLCVVFLPRCENRGSCKTIDPIHKWLPINNSFVSIEINPTDLTSEVDNSKEFHAIWEKFYTVGKLKKKHDWKMIIFAQFFLIIGMHLG